LKDTLTQRFQQDNIVFEKREEQPSEMKKLLNEMNSCQYLPGSLASLGSDDSFVNDLCKDNKNSSYYRALSSVT